MLGISGTSCLPKDTRPPPAEVYVQVSADEAVQSGFDTNDGWHVQLSRFLVTLGRASISGDSCNPYSTANYERIVDVQQPLPQKLAVMYGLGQCDFSFGIVHPASDTVIGAGVTSDEALAMRTAGNDIYTNFAGQLTGINTLVVGTATKGAQSKWFRWEFRLDNYYQGCAPQLDAGAATGLDLQGGSSVTVELRIGAEAFFNVLTEPLVIASGPTQFDVFAAADTTYGNNDSEVTLEELAQVPIGELAKVSPPVAGCLAGVSCPSPDAGVEPLDAAVFHSPQAATPSSLGDYVYYYLQPLIVRYQGEGQCSHTIVRPKRGR